MPSLIRGKEQAELMARYPNNRCSQDENLQNFHRENPETMASWTRQPAAAPQQLYPVSEQQITGRESSNHDVLLLPGTGDTPDHG